MDYVLNMKSLVFDIEDATVNNKYYRKVLYTGNFQLVLMNILPKQEIGIEIHDNIDQFIRVEKGSGIVILNNDYIGIGNGSAILIPAGTEHNIINTSSDSELKLYTIYSPPNHPPNRLELYKKH